MKIDRSSCERAAVQLSPAEHSYAVLCRSLRESPDRPETGLAWCTREIVEAISIPLPGAGQEHGIEIWLGPAARRGDVPRRLRVPGGWLALHTLVGKRPEVQISTASNGRLDAGFGTIAGLMRDRLHPDRHYLLSCGHVMAGAGGARVGDRIDISCAGYNGKATLADWEPAVGAGVLRTGIDAAIARIDDPALLQALQRDSLPAGIVTEFFADQPVTVRAIRHKQGRLKTRWSGYVDIAGNDVLRDYWLQDAIGYRAEPQATEPGDSGAAVWDGGDRLLGIHVAAPTGDERWRSNAVLCPIDRIMEWFDVEPLLKGPQPATLPGGKASPFSATPRPESVPVGSDRELSIIAKTLWGEARGEPDEGMCAVACVIGNRKRGRRQGKLSYGEVCLERWQFSCWNENDPNRPRMDVIDRSPDAAYSRAMTVARELASGQLADFTYGATHYFATSLKRRPDWAIGKTPCYQVGRHLFFNGIK